VVSVVVMLGMAVWFPPGIGMINNIIMPLVLFPLLWAVCFFYAYMSRNLKPVGAVFLAIFIAHGALFFVHFSR
jgi:4-amino-4-deoxy-L-arabinose transferase-like glycosyltransferase